jgi:5-methylcytosine-specific restriction endonuclease McrBC regulatory subunit McrC
MTQAAVVKENQWTNISQLTDAVSGDVREKLENLGVKIQKDLALRYNPVQFRNDGGKLNIRMSGIAGQLSFHGHEILVAPKFVDNPKQGQDWSASTISMMNRVRTTRLTYTPSNFLSRGVVSFVDHVALSFADSLKKAAKRDPIHIYKSREEIRNSLSGRLLIDRQLQHILKRPGTLACEVDYLDTNNDFNHALHFAAARFNALTLSPRVKELVHQAQQSLPKISGPARLPRVIPKTPPPQYDHYMDALEIAGDFLSGIGRSTAHGNVSGYGLLLNMEQLFEKFVERCLQQVTRTNLGDNWDLKAQYSQIYAYPENHGGKNYYTKPDNVIFKDNCPAIVLDAKYKKYSDAEENGNSKPKNSDVYQLVASMASNGCHVGALIYPKLDDTENDIPGNVRLWSVDFNQVKMIVGAITLDLGRLHDSSAILDLERHLADDLGSLLNHRPVTQ